MTDGFELAPTDVLGHWAWVFDDSRGGFVSGEFALLTDGRLATRFGGMSIRAGTHEWRFSEWSEFPEWRKWEPTTDPGRAIRAIKSRGYGVTDPSPVAVDQREARTPAGPVPVPHPVYY